MAGWLIQPHVGAFQYLVLFSHQALFLAVTQVLSFSSHLTLKNHPCSKLTKNQTENYLKYKWNAFYWSMMKVSIFWQTNNKRSDEKDQNQTKTVTHRLVHHHLDLPFMVRSLMIVLCYLGIHSQLRFRQRQWNSLLLYQTFARKQVVL